MTIDKILEYVMKTPYNTNKAVLKNMLEGLVDSAAEEADADDPVAESITITENGTVTAPEGKVYDEIVVNVPIPAVPELEELTINDISVTEYIAPQGKAYSKVIIDTTPAIDPDVQPGG